MLHTDLELLRIILRNLIENALKYSPRETRPRVSLRWQANADTWTVTVANRVGRAGLPDPARLFEKYYRSSGASHRSGSGLGLYLVKGLTNLLGGDLRFEPAGDEARFILTLPTHPTGDQA